jgi:hypothetical protein
MRVFVIAKLPDELAKAFLQHVRDFDTAHPGCHFTIRGQTEMSTDVMVELLKIDPPLPFQKVIKRSEP